MTVKELSEKAAVSDAAAALVKEDSTPSGYLAELEQKELYEDAIRFLAYKLPTDKGVKWASACIKELRSPESSKEKDEPLDAADAWVATPTDPVRRAAKDGADKAKKAGPSKLVALAVYMSGGSLSPPGAPEAAPPPYTAQKMLVGAVLAISVSYQPQNAKERYKKALKLGKDLDGPA